MPRKDAQPGKHEQAAERRVKALGYRKAGLAYRAIGDALGVSEKTAHQDVQRALAGLADLEQAGAEELRTLENARLDDMQAAIWSQVRTGSLKAIQTVLHIMERRARLNGIDAQPGAQLPGNVEITLRWHDDNRQSIIDVTPAADHRDAAAAPQLTESDSTAPGALQVRVRWSEMGQEPAGGDAELENEP